MELSQAIQARRSCRKYTTTPVPASVMEKALDEALLAPNSSNLQLWQFYWIHSSEKKQAVAEACLSQSAATTAQELVVIVADWSLWKNHRTRMLEILRKNNAPPGVMNYYEKLVPIMYTYGPLNLFGWLKKLIALSAGFFKPMPRGPGTRSEVAMVAVKSAALACENFMLSICNQGYATCPMEGFDEVRLRRALGISSCQSQIVMVISVGEADPLGIYGPQIRFDRSLMIKKM